MVTAAAILHWILSSSLQPSVGRVPGTRFASVWPTAIRAPMRVPQRLIGCGPQDQLMLILAADGDLKAWWLGEDRQVRPVLIDVQ